MEHILTDQPHPEHRKTDNDPIRRAKQHMNNIVVDIPTINFGSGRAENGSRCLEVRYRDQGDEEMVELLIAYCQEAYPAIVLNKREVGRISAS